MGSGTGGAPILATAVQATTDTSAANRLVYNPDGYYTYTFSKDITTGVAPYNYQPSLTHRVAIQLSYKNAAGETVLVNPYFDFTLVNGKSVAVTDPSKTRKMTDVSSCNGCHEKLALHGGGRVDTQYCVMCHNPNTKDANSGEVLTLSTMVHKIHSGKLRKSKGESDFTIWGFGSSKHNYAEVGFPQDLRNCTVCHSGANPKTPQGDNWKTKPSKEACLTCHASKVGSKWEVYHKPLSSTAAAAGFIVGGGSNATDLTNQLCVGCHTGNSSNVTPERVHWNQNEENAAKFKMNIESTTFDATARKVTVKYFLSDPTNGNAAYNLVTSECTGTTTITCANTTKFGNLRFYLAYQNMVGQSEGVTEYSAFNNGGSSANAYAYKGTNDGSNHYTVDIPLPADSATAVAKGTARVVSIGQVKEAKLQVKAMDPRPEVVPRVLVNTLVQNTAKELALTGALLPRRTIVSNEKCNVCHGSLGATSGSNTLSEAFHSGARNTVEACVVCHDANRGAVRTTSSVMTNGLPYFESFQFKRLIHGIHGNSKRVSPFTYGNTVVDSFNKDGTSKTGGLPLASTVENYAAEVAWPGVGLNCNACHVNNSYKQDFGTLGAVINKPLTAPGVFETDPNKWLVISPKAASCTACHDGKNPNKLLALNPIGHVVTEGKASFGAQTQAQIAGAEKESCGDCHDSGKQWGVDIVHKQK